MMNYIRRKSFRRLTIYQRNYATPVWEKLFADPEKFFQLPDIHYFKNSPKDSATVALATIGGLTVIIKRYNIKYLVHRIKLWLRRSRAMSSWLNTARLQHLQIPVAEPIACIEYRFGWLRGKAFFIYHYINGPACCDFFPQHNPLTEEAKQALQDVAHTLHKLRKAKMAHGDLHHNNLAIKNQRAFLLDIDNMRYYRFNSWSFRKATQKDLEKFIWYLGEHEEAKNYFREIYHALTSSYKVG